MLVVIAIIGLIMGLVGPRVLSSLGESKVKTAKLQIESFSSSLDLFYLDTRPLSDQQRRSHGAGHNGPTMRRFGMDPI